MKRGLFLVATVTLCSAMYAQGTLSREEAQSIFAQYNPGLLTTAQENSQMNRLLQEVLHTYAAQNLPDTLETRYTLIALARNFENSVALHWVSNTYKQAVLYSQLGGNTQAAAQAAARADLQTIYSRIWAVSVQVKEDLLRAYKAAHKQALRARDKDKAQQYVQSVQSVQADLKTLRTQVGPQIVTLVQDALSTAQEQAQKALQADNLQLKTKHKKPVAE